MLLQRCARNLLLLLVCVGLSATPTDSAWAANGFALERYTPTNPGDWAFWVDKPWYTDSINFLAVGISADYGHDPLVIRSRSATGSLGPAKELVSDQLVGHLELAGAFLNRFNVSLNLPVVFLDRGQAAFGFTPLSKPALSDPRVGAMARLLGNSLEDDFSLHVGAEVWIPLRTGEINGDSSVRVTPKLVAAGVLGEHILYSAFAAFAYRRAATVGALPASFGNTVGSEVQLAASVSWADLIDRWSIGPEAIYSTAVTGGRAFNLYYSSFEILGGIHYNPSGYFHVGLAAGAGIFRAPGTPDFRVLFRVAYTPHLAQEPNIVPDRDADGVADAIDACPDVYGVVALDANHRGCPADRDMDGVADTQDICPDTAMGPKPDAQRHGCPLPDTDGDGILDPNDLCPKLPAGPVADPLRPGCPDPDSDQDGVTDSKDPCPNEPAGVYPDTARLGCPLADRDHDRVVDGVDACPDTAGMPSQDPKKNGCPGLVKIQGTHIVAAPVFFANGKDVILPKSFPTLLSLVELLNAEVSIRRVSIGGHTDNKGNPNKNRNLSERRAKSVMLFLVKHGIRPERLEAHGFGDAQPIADNKTADGRATNRRVAFDIVQ